MRLRLTAFSTRPQVRRQERALTAARERLYYGWVLVGVLALTVTVSYGVLLYAFPVVLAPMQTELGWSQAVLTAGFSVAALTAGCAAIPVGRWVDRFGPRVVMATGSAAATVLVLAWSRVHEPLGYYAIWIGLGACKAAVFYEPAFAVVVQWFREHRVRALTVITVAGGLASTIFVPLASWLVATSGWRGAVAWLAVTLGLLTIMPHALLLPRRPADPGLEHDGAPRVTGRARADEPSIAAWTAFRSPEFRGIGVAFFLATVANFAVTVHLVPLLLARGWSPGFAAASLALLGLAKLPGRLLLAPAGRRLSTPTATLLVFALQTAGLIIVLTIPGAVGVWIFIALFGAGDGASTPARADIVAGLFGPHEYGRICGVLAFFMAAGRAAAPVGASMAVLAFGGYDPVLWILCGVMVAAALALAGATGSSRDGPGPCVHPACCPSTCVMT